MGKVQAIDLLMLLKKMRSLLTIASIKRKQQRADMTKMFSLMTICLCGEVGIISYWAGDIYVVIQLINNLIVWVIKVNRRLWQHSLK